MFSPYKSEIDKITNLIGLDRMSCPFMRVSQSTELENYQIFTIKDKINVYNWTILSKLRRFYNSWTEGIW